MHEHDSRICPHCGKEIPASPKPYASTRLSILMPVYNEKETINEIIDKTRQIKIPKEIIIVDDFSMDGTRDVLRNLEEKSGSGNDFDNTIRVFYHDRNMGKGAAIRTAIKEIKGDFVIIQDADLEYDPMDYFKLLQPLITNKADIVYGSRFLGGDVHRVLYFWHYIGNKMITLLSNMFTNLNLTDIETCYKAFRTDVIRNIPLEQNRFGFEVEITSKIAKADVRFYEVGISYFGRTYREGKKITWKDGIQALYLILKYR